MTDGSPIPLDLIERLVGPIGLGQMVRAQCRGAKFKRSAMLFIRGRRYVAEISYEEPIGPERESGLVVQLGVCVWRDAEPSPSLDANRQAA